MKFNLFYQNGLSLLPSLSAFLLAIGCYGAEPVGAKQAIGGKLDRAAILREIQDFSPTGMDRRLGPRET